MPVFLIIAILAAIFIPVKLLISRYDKRGFDRKGIHKNGTKYDDLGFDVHGFDKNGYDRYGYDSKGYDAQGYNEDGYNICGKNVQGKYNRLYDVSRYDQHYYSEDGFLDPKSHPISITNHARGRINERMANGESVDPYKVAYDAYCFGRSARQVKRTSAGLMRDIESRYDNGIALIHNGFIYIFSEENVLITMYKNENIPL